VDTKAVACVHNLQYRFSIFFTLQYIFFVVWLVDWTCVVGERFDFVQFLLYLAAMSSLFQLSRFREFGKKIVGMGRTYRFGAFADYCGTMERCDQLIYEGAWHDRVTT